MPVEHLFSSANKNDVSILFCELVVGKLWKVSSHVTVNSDGILGSQIIAINVTTCAVKVTV